MLLSVRNNVALGNARAYYSRPAVNAVKLHGNAHALAVAGLEGAADLVGREVGEVLDAARRYALAAGAAKRDPALGPLDVMVHASLAIGDNLDERLAWVKPQLGLYIGGMGAKGRNFYHNLATRYGFGEVADRIQELYLSGRKQEAIDAVPDELVRGMSLIGPPGYVAERMAAFAEAGVTTLLVNPLAADRAESMRFVEEVLKLKPA